MRDRVMTFTAESYATPGQRSKLQKSWCPFCGGVVKRLYHRVIVEPKRAHQWVAKGWYCTACQATFIGDAA